MQLVLSRQSLKTESESPIAVELRRRSFGASAGGAATEAAAGAVEGEGTGVAVVAGDA